MPDENVMSSGTAGWTHSHTTSGSGDYKVIFKTQNTFVDQDINVTVTTPAAVGPTLAVTDYTGTLTMGTASSGVYSPTATITGNAVIGTAGWITAGNHSVSDTSVVVGKVNQSTLKNGTTTIPDGTQITPSASDQTITITEGYNAARTIVVKAASASDPATVTSGQGVINTISGYTYNSEDDNFTVTGSGTVSAPTVGTAGFISSAIGTKNGNTAALSAPVDKIVLTSAITGTGKYVPSIARQTKPSGDGWTDAASGNATTSKPASGVYVAVKSAANTGTISSAPSVSTAGYGDTAHYGKTTDATLVVGADASSMTYVPITTTSASVNKNQVTYGTGWITGGTKTVASGTITSGSATISSVAYTYDSDNSNFTVTGAADVSAPSINTEGYVSSTVGTKNANTGGATVSTTVDKISVKATLSGQTSALTPSITKQSTPSGVTNAASGNATTTAPTSGVYVAVRSAANTATIKATPGVQAAGYGDTSHYTVSNEPTATVGAAQSAMTYIPITTTTATVNGNEVSYGSGWITAGTSTVAAGTVTSGSKAAEFSAPAYNSTSGKFEITASGTIPAPTVNTAGYISSTIGTRNTGSISGTTELAKVKVGVTAPSGSQAVKPTLARTAKPSADTWYDGASGAGTTTKPTSTTKTAYVRVDAAAVSKSISVTGKVSAAGYGTTTSGQYSTDTATSITAGSSAADALYVPIKTGSITSGSATISSVSYTYNSSAGNFTVGGTADVSAPTIADDGYVSADIGTKSANTGGATVATTVAKIGIQANLSGTGTKTPVIAKNANTNVVGAGTATTTKPSSGYYIAVQSPANTGTVQATASVTSAGYGTTTSGQYTTTPSSSLSVGANASAVTYIPVTQATFANAATSGTTYTDISSTAPVLISGDYLYINAGYTPAQKISLARLVPDGASDNLAANFILNGYSAYNDNGVLITGNIPTYTGIYEEV